MTPQESTQYQIRRLQQWNTLWIVLCILGTLFLAARYQMSQLQNSIRALSVVYHAEGYVTFGSSSDGPFVITHLALPYDGGVGVQVTAVLPQPLAYIDSSGASLSKEEVLRLIWRDKHGEKVRAPAPGTKISALYFDPQIASTPERRVAASTCGTINWARRQRASLRRA